MKKRLIIFTIVLSGFLGLHAQPNKDALKGSGDLQLNGIFLRLNGPYDVSNSQDAEGFASNPIIKATDTLGIGVGIAMHFGVNLPFIRKDKWSLGIKANLGLGYGLGVKAAEGLNGLYFDFPQYLYFRINGDNVAVSLLAGYKYVYAPIPYHASLMGLEIHVGGDMSFRLQSMVLPYKYWGLKTDGELFPLIRIRDIGLSYVLSFGKR